MYQPFEKSSAARLRPSAESEECAERGTSRSCLTMEQPTRGPPHNQPHTVQGRAEGSHPAWTEPQHQSYLRNMEESFVAQMFARQCCYTDICGNCLGGSSHHCSNPTVVWPLPLQGAGSNAPLSLPGHSTPGFGIQSSSQDRLLGAHHSSQASARDAAKWQRGAYPVWPTQPVGSGDPAGELEEGEGESEGDSEEKRREPKKSDEGGVLVTKTEEHCNAVAGTSTGQDTSGRAASQPGQHLLTGKSRKGGSPSPQGMAHLDNVDTLVHANHHPDQLYSSPWLRRYLPYAQEQEGAQPVNARPVSGMQTAVNSAVSMELGAPRYSAEHDNLSDAATGDTEILLTQILADPPENDGSMPQDGSEADHGATRKCLVATSLPPGSENVGGYRQVSDSPNGAAGLNKAKPLRARTWLTMARGAGKRKEGSEGVDSLMTSAEGGWVRGRGGDAGAQSDQVRTERRTQGEGATKGLGGPEESKGALALANQLHKEEGGMSEGSCAEGSSCGVRDGDEGHEEEEEECVGVGYNPTEVVPVASRPGWRATKRRKTLKEELMEAEAQLEERWQERHQEGSVGEGKDADDTCTSIRRSRVELQTTARKSEEISQKQGHQGRQGEERGSDRRKERKQPEIEEQGNMTAVISGPKEHHHHYHFHINFFSSRPKQGEGSDVLPGKDAEGDKGAKGGAKDSEGNERQKCAERGEGGGLWVTSGLGPVPPQTGMMSATSGMHWLVGTARGEALADAAQAAAVAAVGSLQGRRGRRGSRRRNEERGNRDSRSPGLNDQTVPIG